MVSAQKPAPFSSQVLLYTSATTRAYMASGGLSRVGGPEVWETYLKKYGFNHRVLNRPEQLDASASGVLVLPSAVALSQRERQAIVDFRARGGSVLATYLCGVRDERGNWLGFGFMENELDVKVVGTIAPDRADSFLMLYGDNPVSHLMPAGHRVWIERSTNWFPLRLHGKNYAGDIMDWGRTFTKDKPTGAIVFDERQLTGNASSRVVALAYPERTWQSADPEQLDPIAHAALTWLQRMPTAYLAAWPSTFKAGLSFAIEAGDPLALGDVALGQAFKDADIRLTYYLLSDNARKSAARLKELQAMGHDAAYMTDRFIVWRGQSKDAQAKRIDLMVKETADAGVTVLRPPAFSPPIGAIDKATLELMQERGFSHYVGAMDATEARLPVIQINGAAPRPLDQALVLIPRTQRGPEDAADEGDVAEAIQLFAQELDLSQRMGGLSYLRMPNGGLLSIEDMAEVIDGLRVRKKDVWFATNAQVTDWWRERARVQTTLSGPRARPELRVDIAAGAPLSRPVSVWLNLPVSGGTAELLRGDQIDPNIKVLRVDAWRVAVVLQGIPAGQHRWTVRFSPEGLQ